MAKVICAMRTDEIFVGNTDKGDSRIAWLQKRGVASARLGDQACDIDGDPLPPERYRPVIINRRDVDAYDNAMMTETFGADWRRRAGRN